MAILTIEDLHQIAKPISLKKRANASYIRRKKQTYPIGKVPL
jgi:hypothetical protein